MGFFDSLGKLFGGGKDKGLGHNPAVERYKGLLDIEQGRKYGKTLEDRLAGIGVGFEPDYLSKTTAPYALARREGFKNYELPSITSAASARGLGRSSVVTNQIGQKAQEAERDIEQRVADISLKNEMQKRAEIEDALGKYGQFAGDIVSGENTKANAVNQEFNRQQGYKQNVEQQRLSGLGSMIKTLGGGIVGYNTGGMGSGVSGLFAEDPEEAYIMALLNKRAALVNK